MPAIFVMEYRSVLDPPLVLAALPARIRERIGLSTTWKTERVSRWLGAVVAFFFNSFRYSLSGSRHATLVHASGLLDHRWSMLFLLREEPSCWERGSSLFTSIALLASEFAVPVVPIRLASRLNERQSRRLPRRRTITVQFGHPVRTHPGMCYQQIEGAMAAEFRSLAEEALT